MGEETDNPGRNIPRALAGTLMLTGVLFVVVMFAQVNGFGTDQAGLNAFQSSGNTRGDLGVQERRDHTGQDGGGGDAAGEGEHREVDSRRGGPALP